MVETDASGAYPRFPLEDARGSVLSVVDADGATKTTFSYSAFGQTTLSGELFPYAFTGRRYLHELGLYDYRSRFYYPWLSRFLERDPIGIWGDGVGLGNGYAYVGNNPVSRVDPFGLQPEGGPARPESLGRTGVVPSPPPEPEPPDPEEERKNGLACRIHLCQENLHPPVPEEYRWDESSAPGDVATEGSDWTLLDTVQAGLDAAGFIPVFGEAFDVVSAAVSLGRGRIDDALLSLGAMVPFAGWAFGGAKWVKKADKAIDAARSVKQASRALDRAAEKGNAKCIAEAAARAKKAVGPGKGRVHGTKVHTAFKEEVEALGRPDLSSEVSYLRGELVTRGTRGSVRVDVVEGPVESPTAVWDLKTGGAKLTPARIDEIQRHVPGGTSVPVREVR